MCLTLIHLCGCRVALSVEELKAKYLKESRLRKKLFNDIMELRGNIRVFARVRPVVPMEDSQGAEVVVTFPDDDSIGLVNSKRQRKQWQFDHVFRPENTNDDVFDQCKDLLTSVVDGYNVCIFAYGQVWHVRRVFLFYPVLLCLNGTFACCFRPERERRTPWKAVPTTLV